MNVKKLHRRPRGQVVANLLNSGMSYAAAVQEYDRLNQADFHRRYAHILNDDWLSQVRI